MAQNPQDPASGATLRVEQMPSWLSPWDEVSPTDTKRIGQPRQSESRGYGVLGEATGEELALVRVFGIALVLLFVIVGIALSQYAICLLTCSEPALH